MSTPSGASGERELRPGDVFAGHRIDGPAGRDATGVVYRATQPAPERVVALRLFAPAPAGDPELADRVRRDLRVLAALDHPNLIAVYEAGEAEGRLYVTTRWFQGTDLAALLSTGRRARGGPRARDRRPGRRGARRRPCARARPRGRQARRRAAGGRSRLRLGVRHRGLARERRLHRTGAARSQRGAAERALGRLLARLRRVRGAHGAPAVPAWGRAGHAVGAPARTAALDPRAASGAAGRARRRRRRGRSTRTRAGDRSPRERS